MRKGSGLMVMTHHFLMIFRFLNNRVGVYVWFFVLFFKLMI